MYQKTKGFLCMLLGIFFVLGFSGTAKVSAAQGVLAHETLHMYAGASVDMDEEISDPTYRIQKITIVTPENSDSIVVSNKHILEAKNAGTTTAQITLVSTKNEEETLDCQVMIIVHEVEKLTMAYGSATRLAAFDYYNPYQEKYTFSNQGAVFNQDYQVVVRGLKTVDVHVTKNNKTFLVAQITVEALSLKNAVVARAVNTTPYQTEVLGYTALGSEKISYISDNTAIADAAEAVCASCSAQPLLRIWYENSCEFCPKLRRRAAAAARSRPDRKPQKNRQAVLCTARAASVWQGRTMNGSRAKPVRVFPPLLRGQKRCSRSGDAS